MSTDATSALVAVQPNELARTGIPCEARVKALDLRSKNVWVAPSGSTLQDIADHMVAAEFHSQLAIVVGGVRFHRKYWSSITPHDGVPVAIHLRPNDISLLLIGIAQFLLNNVPLVAGTLALIQGPLGLGLLGTVLAVYGTTAAVLAGVYFLGKLAINALIDEPPELGGGIRGAAQSPTVNGLGNQELRYNPLWINWGTNRLFPPKGAKPFTLIRGGRRFVREFLITDGANKVTDLKLGDTPVVDVVDDVSTDVLIFEGWDDDPTTSLIPNDVLQQEAGVPLPTPTGQDNRDQIADLTLPWALEGSGLPDVNKITYVGEFVRRTTLDEVDEMTIELNFPRGFYFLLQGTQDPTNIRQPFRMFLQIDYKLSSLPDIEANWNYGHYDPTTANPEGSYTGDTVNDEGTSILDHPGDENWPIPNEGTGRTGDISVFAARFDDVPGFMLYGNVQDAFFASVTLIPPTRGKYDVRIRRLDCVQDFYSFPGPAYANYMNGENRNTHVADVTFVALQEVKRERPINASLTGVTVVELQLDAEKSAGLGGSINAILQSYLPRITNPAPGVYAIENHRDAAEIDRPSYLSNNAARAYLDQAINRGDDKLTASDIDLEALYEWQEFIESQSRETNIVIDYDSTKADAWRLIAGSARASYNTNSNLLSVAFEQPDKPVQGLFNPEDMTNFRMESEVDDIPDALRIRFRNEQKGYSLDERVVPRDGFSSDGGLDGLPVPIVIQDVRVDGTTNPTQIYKDARVEIALLLARNRRFSFGTGLQHLPLRRGDKIEISHPAMLVGLSQARVRGVTLSGADLTDIDLTSPVRFDPGSAYVLRVAVADAVNNRMSVINIPLDNPATVEPVITNSVSLTAPIDTTTELHPTGTEGKEELVTFGIATLATIECIVTKKVWHSDLTADLECVPAADASFGADTGYIPPFSSNVTIPPANVSKLPPQPSIREIVSDESVIVKAGSSIQYRMLVNVNYELGASSPVSSSLQVRARPRFKSPGFASGGESYGPWVVSDASSDYGRAFLNNVEMGQIYEVQARAVSIDPALPGATSLWSTSVLHEVVGATGSEPGTVETLRVASFSQVVFGYEVDPPDLLGFRLRVGYGDGVTWESAQPLHDTLVSSPFPLSETGKGTRTLFVKGVDIAGLESLEPAVLTTSAEAELTNAVRSVDYEALAFPGTITGGTVNGAGPYTIDADATASTVYSGVIADEDNPEPTPQLLYEGGGAAFYKGPKYSELTYEFTVAVVAADLPGALLVSGTFQGAFVTFYEKTSGAWVPFNGSLGLTSAGNVELKVVIAGGSTQGVISSLDVTVDAPDIVLSGTGLAVIAPGGTRLPVAALYRGLTSLEITIDNSGGGATAVGWRFLDKNLALGPLIELLDAAGAQTPGSVDWRTVGY